ncbi:MAG: hypothetical protein WC704_17730 [Sphingomonas sp.]
MTFGALMAGGILACFSGNAATAASGLPTRDAVANSLTKVDQLLDTARKLERGSRSPKTVSRAADLYHRAILGSLQREPTFARAGGPVRAHAMFIGPQRFAWPTNVGELPAVLDIHPIAVLRYCALTPLTLHLTQGFCANQVALETLEYLTRLSVLHRPCLTDYAAFDTWLRARPDGSREFYRPLFIELDLLKPNTFESESYEELRRCIMYASLDRADWRLSSEEYHLIWRFWSLLMLSRPAHPSEAQFLTPIIRLSIASDVQVNRNGLEFVRLALANTPEITGTGYHAITCDDVGCRILIFSCQQHGTSTYPRVRFDRAESELCRNYRRINS